MLKSIAMALHGWFLLVFLLSTAMVFFVLHFLAVATVADYSIEIFVIMNGFWFTVISFFLSAIISVLFGLYVSLLAYKITITKKFLAKQSIAGSVGLVVGALGAGCPSCGSIIFLFFGMPLVLFFLPFKGLEFKAIGIALLAVSVFLASKNLAVCETKNKTAEGT